MIIGLDKYKLLAGIKAEDATQDNIITGFIELAEVDYLSIRNKPFDVDENKNIIYPTGAESVAFNMVKFRMDNLERIGMQSESIGDYSYALSSGNLSTGGYPSFLIVGIKRYADVI